MYGLLDTCPEIHTFSGHLSGKPYISLQILKFLNGCILFNIGPINTKLKDFVKLGVLFPNIWVLCC